MLRTGVTGYQLFSYVVSMVMLPATAVTVFPFATPWLAVGVLLAYIYIYAWIIYLTLKDSCVDELKTNIQLHGYQRKSFQSSQGRHVIENGHCAICDINVSKSTKHCKKCNYCVAGFDHHCVWLNNCIGETNYRYFMCLVISICVLSAVTAVFASYLFVAWFSEQDLASFQVPYFGVSDIFRFVWLISCIATIVVYVVTCAVTAHLLFFHLRLLKQGTTTYKYMVSQRRAKISSMATISNISRQT